VHHFYNYLVPNFSYFATKHIVIRFAVRMSC